MIFTILTGAKVAEQTIATEYRSNIQVKTSPSFVPPVRIFFEDFKDERPQPEQVGENLENKGKRVLILTGDPRAAGKLMRLGLRREFQKKGFQTIDQPDQAEKFIGGTIIKFWTVETNRYNTETQLRVEVRDSAGTIYFSRLITGVGKNFGRSLSPVNYNESFGDSPGHDHRGPFGRPGLSPGPG